MGWVDNINGSFSGVGGMVIETPMENSVWIFNLLWNLSMLCCLHSKFYGF